MNEMYLTVHTVNELKGDKVKYQILTLSDTNEIPYSIICNGLNLKETIKDELYKYCDHILYDDITEPCNIDKISQEITEILSIKLGIKQGDLNE
jgi:hypothetical protein